MIGVVAGRLAQNGYGATVGKYAREPPTILPEPKLADNLTAVAAKNLRSVAPASEYAEAYASVGLGYRFGVRQASMLH